MKKYWYKRLIRTVGISERSTLLCEQKIVNQSSDFPVRRTGSYRHKKAPDVFCWIGWKEMGWGLGAVFDVTRWRLSTKYIVTVICK